jgi:transcription elongation factor Elf1
MIVFELKNTCPACSKDMGEMVNDEIESHNELKCHLCGTRFEATLVRKTSYIPDLSQKG